MNLSSHFTLEELIASSTADRHGIDNYPGESELANLHKLANKLEEIRVVVGYPIIITSAFRCSKLNKLIGSTPKSDHLNGLAADIKCPQFGTPEELARFLHDSDISFDQIILEYPTPSGGGWVHIGIGSRWRNQLLTINQHGTYSGIQI